jgi:DNA-binding GntR family transcriptional regulator
MVSTISLEEAEQLCAARSVLEEFAWRECVRLRDHVIVRRIGDALVKLKAPASKGSFRKLELCKARPISRWL